METRFVGWGAGIVDLDNDGYPDLFWVTGSMYPEVGKSSPNYPFKTPRVVFPQFEERQIRRIDQTRPDPAIAARALPAAAAHLAISITTETSTC